MSPSDHVLNNSCSKIVQNLLGKYHSTRSFFVEEKSTDCFSKQCTSANSLIGKTNDTGLNTAPAEHISPKADTNEPIAGQVRNDAVLRGE
jgi:hypothetical protein